MPLLVLENEEHPAKTLLRAVAAASFRCRHLELLDHFGQRFMLTRWFTLAGPDMSRLCTVLPSLRQLDLQIANNLLGRDRDFQAKDFARFLRSASSLETRKLSVRRWGMSDIDCTWLFHHVFTSLGTTQLRAL